jgi:hypothetical protein
MTPVEELFILDVRPFFHNLRIFVEFLFFKYKIRSGINVTLSRSQECSHKYCKTCLRNYVIKQVCQSVTTTCPLKDCGAALSVRDMKVSAPNFLLVKLC